MEILESNDKIFKQPEGICFNPQGDLFISNESKDGRTKGIHLVLRINISNLAIH